MESDESRPGSSASVSSDSSGNSDNSRPSSPTQQPASPNNQKSPVSSHGSSSHKSRSQTRSKSGSRSSSLSSDNENQPNIAQSDSNQAIRNNNEEIRNSSPRSNSSRSSSSSSNDNSHGRLGNVSRNQSISPVRKSRSSRNSSLSSTQSQDRELTGNLNGGRLQNDDDDDDDDDDNKEENALNMSHEDLSDVSDMESERNDIKRNARESKENLFNVDEEANVRTNKTTNQNNQESGHEDDEENGDEKEENDKLEDDAIITDLRQKLDQKKNQLKAMTKEKNGDLVKSNGSVSDELDDLEKKHDEDALDFEAEEGECPDIKDDEKPEKEPGETDKKDSDGEVEEGEELEEGEVTDEEEKRPEETEPKPVCRFYTRGQCTWGMSCRFLHPGVTDKGNYTMFDMVRPVPVSHGAPLPNNFGGHGGYHDYRTERPALHHRPPLHHHPAYVAPHHDPRILPPVVVADPPVPMVESAWERGLRTAKEMMRKANKRKEQDMDFEDKKMNLTLSQDELEKDNYYIRDRASPDQVPPPFPAARHPPPAHFEPDVYSPPAKFGRGLPIFEEDPYGRTPRYRELPPHRMPQYEDERRVRPAREVIVQRVENVGRGDEWNDPWMRSKSPQARSGPDSRERPDKRIPRSRRSYSSNSSYSSSSTSRSGSSSETSRSPTPDPRRQRYNSTHSSHKSPPPQQRRHIKTAMRSPSPRRRRTPTSHVVNEFKEHKVKKVDLGARRSPIKKRHMSPSSEKRVIVSPGGKRKKISPISSRKVAVMEKSRKRRRTGGSSSSGSSDSSGSDSESSYSSSSEDSSSRANTPVKRPTRNIEKTVTERKVVKKGIELPKKRSPISIEIKKPTSNMQITPDGNSQSSSSTPAGSKKTTRREELLKQLRAVEDAIARKRSKLN